MKLITDFIRTKSLTDTSQAMALRMLEENVGREDEVISLLFQAMYDTNLKLQAEVIRLRKESTAKPRITIT